MTLVYIALTIFTTILLIYIIYNLDLDYYEDALNTTRAKNGNSGFNQLGSKVRKVKGEFKYNGAKAILSKQILEAKKIGLIFIDKSTFFFAVISLVTAYFNKSGNIDTILYMLIYMALLFTSSNKWALELKNHYIFLIPEPSIKKVLYATSLEIIKSLISGLIIFILTSFIYKVSIFHGIALAFTYTSFSAIILYSDLVIRRMIGNRVSLMVEVFLKIIITVIFALPGIILSFTLGSLVSEYTGIYGRYIIQIMYNILASILLVTLSKGIFEKLEIR